MAKARAMVRKMPAFFFSSYGQSAFNSPALMRMGDMATLVADMQADYGALLAAGGAGAASSGEGNVTTGPSGASPGGGGGGGPQLFPVTPQWLNASAAWYVAAVPQLGAGSAVNASTSVCPAATAGAGLYCVSAAAALLDNDDRTVAVAAPARGSDLARVTAGIAAAINATGAVYVTLDVGACGAVAGLRLGAGTAAEAAAAVTAAGTPASPPGTVQLFALADAAASGYTLVHTAELDRGGAAGAYAATFPSYSARYWALVVTPSSPNAAASLLALPDARLMLARVPAGGCQADTLSTSDAAPGVPKQRLLVRLAPGVSGAERQRVLNGVRSTLGGDASIQVQDTANLLASTEVAVVGLTIFFNFVAALALILCFFAAWLSFTANVNENSVEFGVLRSLGLSTAAVTRVFIYEALTVVLSAFLLGTGIGLLIAISLTLQFNLFTEDRFAFDFPIPLFLLTLLGCSALAVASSYWPARRLGRLHIAAVLKGRTR
jgi:hypothetical protein